MAKTKQPSGSAAQRREQVRGQRTNINQHQNARMQQSRRSRKSQRGNNPWPLIIGTVVMVVAVVVIFIVLSNQSKPQVNTSSASKALKGIETVDPNLLASVGGGGLDSSMQSLIKPVTATPLLKGPNGKPEVFYMGGEYCPYCAAQRWSMTIALSRFGTFNSIAPIISAEDSISTFSFHGSTYHSQYIDFVPVEVSDNTAPPNSQPLENLTGDQQALVDKYDAPPYTDANGKGSFPFLSIGNQYVSSGAFYDPTLIMNHSYDDIANQLKDSSTDISRNVLGSANYMTAMICSMTKNQPANVCTADPIPQLQAKLPKPSAYSNATHLGALGGPIALATRRED